MNIKFFIREGCAKTRHSLRLKRSLIRCSSPGTNTIINSIQLQIPYGKEVCSFISYNVADVIIFENIFLYFVADV